MNKLQVLPLEDLASRRNYRKPHPQHEIVVEENLLSLDEQLKVVFEDLKGVYDVTIDIARLPLTSLSDLTRLEEVLKNFVSTYPKKVKNIRLRATSAQVRTALLENISLNSFSEVAVELSHATSLLLEVLKGVEAPPVIVLLIDASDLTVSIQELLYSMRLAGFVRVEVSELSCEALDEFRLQCFPLYRLPGDSGIVGVWKESAVVVPAHPKETFELTAAQVG